MHNYESINILEQEVGYPLEFIKDEHFCLRDKITDVAILILILKRNKA